jgi:hypothetical protein
LLTSCASVGDGCNLGMPYRVRIRLV